MDSESKTAVNPVNPDNLAVPTAPELDEDILWKFYLHRRHYFGFDPRKGQIPIRPDQFPCPAGECPSYSERTDVEKWLRTLECTHDNDKECVLTVEYLQHECNNGDGGDGEGEGEGDSDSDGGDCDCQYDLASYDHQMIYEELVRHGLPISTSYKPVERLPGHVVPSKRLQNVKMCRRLFALADAEEARGAGAGSGALRSEACGKHDRQEEMPVSQSGGTCKCDHCLAQLPCRVQSKRLKVV
jgi:hypothetical protein